jgi:transcriptional regulator with XRE-family HTH domain
MPADINFRLRHNLFTLLKERDMTAAQLSRKTGVAKQVLSDWMSGVQPRKIEHLFVVARELGVSMESLCFAASDSELLSNTQVTPSAGSDFSGSILSAPLSSQGSFSPDEIKGRFEIHLRRITDD